MIKFFHSRRKPLQGRLTRTQKSSSQKGLRLIWFSKVLKNQPPKIKKNYNQFNKQVLIYKKSPFTNYSKVISKISLWIYWARPLQKHKIRISFAAETSNLETLKVRKKHNLRANLGRKATNLTTRPDRKSKNQL